MAATEAPGGSDRGESLDDPALYASLDPSNLRDRLRDFPSQFRRAWDEAVAFELPHGYVGVQRVVVAGMGGSAIGGDLVADLASLEDAPPIVVSRDYRVPSYVDGDTLVLVCSYSGETEETLSSFRQALELGARIVALTGGGTLAAEAAEHDIPVFQVGYSGEPRSALGYGFIVPMVLMIKLGLISDKAAEFAEAVSVLDGLATELSEDVGLRQNFAKQIAVELLGRLIIVYGASIFGGVARRWKTQLNENSKVAAFLELLPEAHHNAVVGYALPSEVRESTYAVLLRPASLHPRLELRYEVTSDLLARDGIPHRVVGGRGESALSQMLSAVLMGDYVSYYLALLQGVDPSPVSTIDYIKGRLAESR